MLNTVKTSQQGKRHDSPENVDATKLRPSYVVSWKIRSCSRSMCILIEYKISMNRSLLRFLHFHLNRDRPLRLPSSSRNSQDCQNFSRVPRITAETSELPLAVEIIAENCQSLGIVDAWIHVFIEMPLDNSFLPPVGKSERSTTLNNLWGIPAKHSPHTFRGFLWILYSHRFKSPRSNISSTALRWCTFPKG